MKNKKNTPSKAKALAEKPVSPPAPVPEKPKSPAAKVAPHLYGRLLGIMKSRGAEEATESQKDFGATALAQMAPRNTAEVMLCSQMVATWEVGMSMLTASKQSTDFQSLEAQGNLAVKLLSVFERQFSALTKARKPLQVVTVEHVHKHLHVNAPGPTGVMTEIEGQAHATDPEPSPLRMAQRCLAKTRRGTLCQSPATRHGRCRMHGGAPGTGAPSGERNGSWKHGRYSQAHIALRRAIRALAREARATLATMSNDGG